MIRFVLLSLLVLPTATFANEDPKAQKHCLVTRAIAVTANKERMDLLLGTDDDARASKISPAHFFFVQATIH
jgi:hypothetical protein